MAEEKQGRTMDVVEYDCTWKEIYETEAENIRDILKDEVVNIYHIGSTAIPGICAKPIIDVLVEVKNISKIDGYNGDLIRKGYIPQGENGIKGRRFFLKGLFERTHHVHMFETGNTEIERHIKFRDYLIYHPEEAKVYGELKRNLSELYYDDSEGYCNGKSAFIKDIDEKAKIWNKNTL